MSSGTHSCCWHQFWYWHTVLTVVADTCSKTVLIESQTVSSGIQVSECVTAEFAQNSVLPSTLYCVNYKLHNWMEKRCMLVVMWVRVYLHYKRRNALHKWEDNNINDVCLLSWIMWSPRCLRDFTYINGCILVLWSGKSPGLKSQEKLHCYTKLHKSVDIRRMQQEYENPCV